MQVSTNKSINNIHQGKEHQVRGTRTRTHRLGVCVLYVDTQGMSCTKFWKYHLDWHWYLCMYSHLFVQGPRRLCCWYPSACIVLPPYCIKKKWSNNVIFVMHEKRVASRILTLSKCSIFEGQGRVSGRDWRGNRTRPTFGLLCLLERSLWGL